MKPEIDFNTQLRTKAKNDFEKDFFKLMNNSIFEKMMENIRKHRNIKLVMTEEKYLKTVMKPNFKSGVRFNENIMGCEMDKINVVIKTSLSRPSDPRFKQNHNVQVSLRLYETKV